MTKMGKTLVVIATVAGIGAAGFAVAQPYGPGGYGPMGQGPGFMHGPGMMGGWGRGYADPSARLDALKAELAIRPEQQAAWDGYVKALQDGAAQMQSIRGEMFRSMGPSITWQQHQAAMAKLFDQRAAAFKTVQDAGAKLIAVLDDAQKARVALPGLAGYGPGMGGGPGWGRGPGMGWGGGPGMMGDGGMGWGPGSGAR